MRACLLYAHDIQYDNTAHLVDYEVDPSWFSQNGQDCSNK